MFEESPDRQTRSLRDLAADLGWEFSRRVETVPRLTDCPECGFTPLRLVGSLDVRCRCGWTGVILRPLP